MADYLKIPELARRLDVSEKTARRYVKAGALPSAFIGGAYRVTEEDLEAFLRGAEVKPGDASPKAEAPSSQRSLFNDGEDERREDVYGMVLAAARRQAEQDRQAATRALESERPQAYFMRQENEVVLRLLEHPPDEVAGTLVEVARHCVWLEGQLEQIKAATSAEPARSGATSAAT